MNLIELSNSIEEEQTKVNEFFGKIRDSVLHLASMIPNGTANNALVDMSTKTKKGKKAKRKSNMSPAMRAKQSARMKAYWLARRKAKGKPKGKK